MKFGVSLPLNAVGGAKVAPEVRNGRGLVQQKPKERSKLVGGQASKEIFFHLCKMLQSRTFFHFLRPWGGHGPLGPIPLERPMAEGSINAASMGRG